MVALRGYFHCNKQPVNNLSNFTKYNTNRKKSQHKWSWIKHSRTRKKTKLIKQKKVFLEKQQHNGGNERNQNTWRIGHLKEGEDSSVLCGRKRCRHSHNTVDTRLVLWVFVAFFPLSVVFYSICVAFWVLWEYFSCWRAFDLSGLP